MPSGPVSSWGSKTDSAAPIQLLLGVQQCLRQLAPSRLSFCPGHNPCKGLTTPTSQNVNCHRGQPCCWKGTRLCLAAHACFLEGETGTPLSLLPPSPTPAPLRHPDVCTCLQAHSWPHSPRHPRIECKGREARGLCGQGEGL